MKLRFEKFERKYNFQLPDSYKLLITEMGDGYIIGNCEFYPAVDFVDNNLRCGGAMEARIFPFGGLGNGDCFCFLKYGENPDEYCIVLWLSETYNYVILNSTFDNFIYNCMVQEYKALLYPEEYMAEGTRDEYEECIEKINSVSSLFDFDIEELEKARSENELNMLILDCDPFAVQLLCKEGKKLLEQNNEYGVKLLNRAVDYAPFYAAQYYILGKYFYERDKTEALRYYFKAAQAPLAASGYSYWDEDDAGIPQFAMEEVFSDLLHFKELLPKEYMVSPYMDFISRQKPYDPDYRFVLAEKLLADGDYDNCIRELNNVLILTEDPALKIKVLNMLMPIYEKAGLVWASGVCKKDIKYIKAMKSN